MAEVLGTVSAALSIVELAGKLAQCTKDIWNSEKDWERFAAEVTDLSRALKRWANDAHEFQELDCAAESFDQLLHLLRELESKAAKKPTTLTSKLVWHFTKHDAKELFGAVERVKSLVLIQLEHASL
jgi:hypothetical protein